ncbi:MAG TPA: SEC-C metal-binding domain-containing protein [Xanthobacteraceae bacterium]|jgi:hypothetical protein
MTNGTPLLSVLDPRQLERIQSVHRGFLYQHLYAVACLLGVGASGALSVQAETDEDVEVRLPDRHIYVQVKMRAEALIVGDISGALNRFAALRKEHQAGKRTGKAIFVVASNSEPGPQLKKRMAESGWPADVAIHWPGMTGAIDPALPRPWPDIPSALGAVAQTASTLPFAMLAPETLVWKLSGNVLAAAAGIAPRSDHMFRADELTSLFEQLVVQLQDFPAPPARYRPQADEPPLLSNEPVRIITGFSGAGKTSWVSQAALHTNDNVVYFNVADTPSPALKSAIARELAVHLFGGRGGKLGEVLLPGASPTEILFAINRSVEQQGTKATLVIDNAHRVSPQDIQALTTGHTHLRFLLLCQPSANVQELEGRLAITAEPLRGWETDTIAAEGHDLGCQGDFAAFDRLRTLTAGLPLYAQNALTIASRNHAGSVSAFCKDIEAQTHIVETVQELILRRVFATLEPSERDAAGALSLCEVPLDRAEAFDLLKNTFGMTAPGAAALFRKLRTAGLMQLYGGDRVKLHDATRIVARAHLTAQGGDVVRRAQITLKDILVASLPNAWSPQKVSQLMRTFVALDEIRPLVELGRDELFHEMGMMPEIEAYLAAAVQAPGLTPEQRFWALDGLVFADFKQRAPELISPRLDEMARLISEHDLGSDERLAVGMKRMMLAARAKDIDGVRKAMEETAALLPDSPEHERIARYNFAHAMFELDMYDACATVVEPIMTEYYTVLGISPATIFMKNPDRILPLLPKDKGNLDDLKHLADCCDLLAMALNSMGQESGLLRLNAMKFYQLANAVDSLFRVGQDLVDEFVARHDYEGARDLIERNLIPNLTHLKVASRVIPIRSQYAVVLAYCGDFDRAEQEMARLAPYEAGLDEQGKRELQNQQRAIARMRLIPPPPQWQPIPHPQRQPTSQTKRKVGRNDPCPCGSGKKYKKCHGRV